MHQVSLCTLNTNTLPYRKEKLTEDSIPASVKTFLALPESEQMKPERNVGEEANESRGQGEKKNTPQLYS